MLCTLGWYMFLKPEDYIVRFKVAASPGTLLKQVEEWSLIQNNNDSASFTINEKIPFEVIQQSVKKNNISLELDWVFKSISDSVSQVTVGVSEKEHSLYNRLTAPFLNTNFKKTAIGLIQDYKSGMEFRLKNNFKVKCLGIDNTPKLQYAYLEIKNINLLDKAAKMMEINEVLLKFLNDNDIKDSEFPFLIVDEWDLHENTIDFKYCFAVKNKDSLPFSNQIKYDILPSRKSLKAIYNGNYRTSDRAWFALHEYSKRHDIPIETKPIEFFKSNPFHGGNELKWVTEVYIPIKN